MELKKDDRKMRGALPLYSLCTVSAEEKICYAACAQMPYTHRTQDVNKQTKRGGGV
jgi:hypothetical protein